MVVTENYSSNVFKEFTDFFSFFFFDCSYISYKWTYTNINLWTVIKDLQPSAAHNCHNWSIICIKCWINSLDILKIVTWIFTNSNLFIHTLKHNVKILILVVRMNILSLQIF